MTQNDLEARLPGLVPLDKDGYAPSFVSSDKAGVQGFFQKYGFVIIRDALSSEACDFTLSEFYKKAAKSGLDPKKTATWETFWDSQRFGQFGIVGGFPEFSPAQLKNRCSQEVYDGFVAVLQSERLWVDHDRLGVLAPTKKWLGGSASWKTIENWLHLDCNPVSYDTKTGFASIGGFEDSGAPIDFHKTLIIQGLLTLTDARVEDGGFHCVPGSHKISIDWATANKDLGSSGQSSMQVPKEDPLRAHIQKIPIKRGCLLAWSSLLMHGNHPNNSKRMRAVQYIRMMPEGTPYSPLEPDPSAYPENFEVTELAARLLGFEAWSINH
ncbi:MAG: phytanoyl-CoA dioxygenase family protein [Planctomycetota bacterium]|nr:phytanoyl-CoA dioxygenase family protein [Planctomycetota bacterium]